MPDRKGRGSIEVKGLSNFESVRDLRVSGSITATGSITMGQSIADGDSHLILSSSAGSIVHVSGALKLPQENDSSSPTIQFGDGDTGIYEGVDDILRITFGGTQRWDWGFATLKGTQTNGPEIAAINTANTTPNYRFSDDSNTGMGRADADQLSLIAGSKELMRLEGGGHTILSSSGGSIVHASASLETDGQIGSLLSSELKPSGSDQTQDIDLNNGNSQILFMNSGSSALTATFSNPVAGNSYIIKTVQHASTPIGVFFSGSSAGSVNVKHEDGNQVQATQTADAEDIFSFWYDGEFFYATMGSNFS